MKHIFHLLTITGMLTMTALADINAGDMAPEFQLTGSDGNTYTLSQFKNKQAVVIAWFPKAFTGG